MSKIVAIGDPHIKLDNFDEFNIFEESLHNLIDRETPDLIVVLGDVLHYHEKIFTPCLNRAYQFIKRLGEKTQTFVLVGNHDMINNQQFLTENHWMNSLKKVCYDKVVIVDKVIRYSDLIFCPYVFPGRFEEALLTLEDYDYRGASIIFAHQEFKGCKMGAIISEGGDVWGGEEEKNCPLVISGHVHLNQWVGSRVYYTGSALQHAFGESEKNIIAVIECGGRDNIKIREVDLNLPRKRIIAAAPDTLDKVASKVLDRLKEYGGDKIRVTVNGTQDEFKLLKTTEPYKKLVKEGIKVVFKQRSVNLEALVVGSSKPSADDDFFSILRNLVTEGGDPDLYKIYEKFIYLHK